VLTLRLPICLGSESDTGVLSFCPQRVISKSCNLSLHEVPTPSLRLFHLYGRLNLYDISPTHFRLDNIHSSFCSSLLSRMLFLCLCSTPSAICPPIPHFTVALLSAHGADIKPMILLLVLLRSHFCHFVAQDHRHLFYHKDGHGATDYYTIAPIHSRGRSRRSGDSGKGKMTSRILLAI